MRIYLLGYVPPVVLLGVEEEGVGQQRGLHDHQVPPLGLAVPALDLHLSYHLLHMVIIFSVSMSVCQYQ